jgi:hypothetical protein
LAARLENRHPRRFKHRPFWWSWPSLILGKPVSSTAFAFSGGLDFQQALTVPISITGPERFTNLTTEWIILFIGNGRQPQNFPFISLNALEPTHQVVFVQRGSD